MYNQCYGNCNWLMLNSSIWYQINDASGNKVGIKKDKSSSAAAVNSLRAAASYPPGVNVGCFWFFIIKCNIMCITCVAYIYQISCVSCLPRTSVLSMYPVCPVFTYYLYITCIVCLGIKISTYHIHHFQIAGQYIIFCLMYQIFKKRKSRK